MMAAILNSTMLDSATAILDSDTLLSSLKIHSKTLSLHSDSDSKWMNQTSILQFNPDSNSFILT